jgi:serine/threonine-protein kinase RsbW
VSRVHFVIDSDLCEVALVAMAVNTICIHLGLGKIQASEVELCVAEAVTNSIRHAWRNERGHTVSVAVSAQKDELQIDISDRGAPMGAEHIERLHQVSQEAEPEKDDRLQLAEGGRGLQIIHDLMDGAEYTSQEGMNRLRLIKRIPPPEAGR